MHLFWLFIGDFLSPPMARRELPVTERTANKRSEGMKYSCGVKFGSRRRWEELGAVCKDQSWQSHVWLAENSPVNLTFFGGVDSLSYSCVSVFLSIVLSYYLRAFVFFVCFPCYGIDHTAAYAHDWTLLNAENKQGSECKTVSTCRWKHVTRCQAGSGGRRVFFRGSRTAQKRDWQHTLRK